MEEVYEIGLLRHRYLQYFPNKSMLEKTGHHFSGDILGIFLVNYDIVIIDTSSLIFIHT